MLSAQVYDVLAATQAALAVAAPTSADEARQCPALVCFSAGMAAKSAVLKRFLFTNLYRHQQVLTTTQTAKDVVRDLFKAYSADPAQMPSSHAVRLNGQSADRDEHPALKTGRVVADYIAGMTDRFAAKEHQRLYGGSAFNAAFG